MPLRRNALGAVYRSHDFSVMRDPGRLRAALRVRVTARASRAETAVSLRLEGGVIGHAFPTGDLFREGEVRAWVEGAPATLRTQTLSRRYVRVRVNVGAFDRHPALLRRHGVTRIANYVVLDPATGERVAQTTMEPITRREPLSSARWAAWLEAPTNP
jgi:hypothetical protein